jgi:shikimate kinase
VSVALDRRALCRVESAAAGVTLESKDSLTKTAAADVSELLARTPGSVAAQALGIVGATIGLRVVTEWKLPAGSGVDGDSALALAATEAVARFLGRELSAEELLRLSREAARRAGRGDEGGHHAALWGGVVLARGVGETLAAESLQVDPGRVEESLLLVDGGEGAADPSPDSARAAGRQADEVAAALAAGRFEDLVGLLTLEAGEPQGSPAAARLIAVARGAGGAAWRLPRGRLVAVWAPPGARGPGRAEAVREALKAAGVRPIAIRVDLRGLEVD